jgi:hypothetical protein
MLVLPRKPQVGEVIAHVLHGVGLVRQLAPDRFDFGSQIGLLKRGSG